MMARWFRAETAPRRCRGKPQHGEALTLSRKSRGAVFKGKPTANRKAIPETDLRNGTSPQTLLRIRRGMEVKPKTVGRIARALGVDVTDIIQDATAMADNAN